MHVCVCTWGTHVLAGVQQSHLHRHHPSKFSPVSAIGVSQEPTLPSLWPGATGTFMWASGLKVQGATAMVAMAAIPGHLHGSFSPGQSKYAGQMETQRPSAASVHSLPFSSHAEAPEAGRAEAAAVETGWNLLPQQTGLGFALQGTRPSREQRAEGPALGIGCSSLTQALSMGFHRLNCQVLYR